MNCILEKPTSFHLRYNKQQDVVNFWEDTDICVLKRQIFEF